MKHEHIADQLKHAFRARPRPSNTEMVASDVSEYEAQAFSALLIEREPWSLTPLEIRDVIGTNLWMFSPKAFHYYLPALLSATLNHFGSVSMFANEVVDALIRPEVGDADAVIARFEGKDEAAFTVSLKTYIHEWYDSGWPDTLFLHRFGTLTQEEGEAVLKYIEAFRDAHGENFPFDELNVAIERYWQRYG
ncbi:hypothetical protein L4D15_02715 [Enterovibrio norvegicus]|uniref:hypothetical protein n=1 Tax=Enterovibrio norvegicus TaxID=188144 RepID=UPI003D0E5B6C